MNQRSIEVMISVIWWMKILDLTFKTREKEDGSKVVATFWLVDIIAFSIHYSWRIGKFNFKSVYIGRVDVIWFFIWLGGAFFIGENVRGVICIFTWRVFWVLTTPTVCCPIENVLKTATSTSLSPFISLHRGKVFILTMLYQAYRCLLKNLHNFLVIIFIINFILDVSFKKNLPLVKITYLAFFIFILLKQAPLMFVQVVRRWRLLLHLEKVSWLLLLIKISM